MQVKRKKEQHPSKPRVSARVAARTDIGLVRKTNEDNYLVLGLERGERDEKRLDRIGARGFMFAVCDGVGGSAAGEVASQIAVESLARKMQSATLSSESAFARAMVQAIHVANVDIRKDAKANPSREGMSSTCTVAGIHGTKLFLGQVGDSRAYVLRCGVLAQLTKDQSLVNHLVELGQISAAEAECSPKSNIILQSLGSSEDIRVDLSWLDLCQGDRLLLCTDGLSGVVDIDLIYRALTKIDAPDACAERLIELARAAGGRDNITALVCDLSGDDLGTPRAEEIPEYRGYDLDAPTEAANVNTDVGSPRLRRGAAGVLVALLFLVAVFGTGAYRYMHRTQRAVAAAGSAEAAPRPAEAGSQTRVHDHGEHVNPAESPDIEPSQVAQSSAQPEARAPGIEDLRSAREKPAQAASKRPAQPQKQPRSPAIVVDTGLAEAAPTHEKPLAAPPAKVLSSPFK